MSQTHGRPERGAPPSTPGWVKLFGIIGIAALLLFIIMHLAGLTPMGGH